MLPGHTYGGQGVPMTARGLGKAGLPKRGSRQGTQRRRTKSICHKDATGCINRG